MTMRRRFVPHRVAGYSRDEKNATIRARFRDISENLPAGGYLSTAEDMVRFAEAFVAGTLVKAETRDAMLEHPKLNDGSLAPNPMGDANFYYGMGIMVGPEGGQTAWFHTGGQAGASALLFYFPASKVSVAVMTNMDHGAVRESLARKIGDIAAGN